MISTTTIPAAFGLAFLATNGPLRAQGYPVNPANRPAVSPFINLTRQGSSGGVNYYGLVRPEIQFRGALLQNQQEIASNQQALSNLQGGVLTTGHHAAFMTQWRDFTNTGIGAPTPAFRRSLTPPGGTASPKPNATRRKLV